MATETKLMTADELLRLDSEQPCELVQGELVMMTPAGGEHGEIAGNLFGLLWHHVSTQKLGRAYAAETGFLLERGPDTVLAPDVAFIRAERLPGPEARRGYIPVVPDFVAEVASPKQAVDLRAKAEAWLNHGVPLAWVVWPATRSVSIHRPQQPVALAHEGDRLEGGEAVPGFACAVDALFE